ncbi:hypothetical protein D3C71_1933920 [compost metagenome]
MARHAVDVQEGDGFRSFGFQKPVEGPQHFRQAPLLLQPPSFIPVQRLFAALKITGLQHPQRVPAVAAPFRHNGFSHSSAMGRFAIGDLTQS